MKTRLERYFQFRELQTNWRTEILAGATTFVTMAYIIFVNPAILGETGMPLPAVAAATCLCAALGSLLMGIFARYPIALAPGMGLNAYFTYTVVKGMNVPWETALGAVFLASLIIPNLKWLFIIFGAGLIGFTAFEVASALRQAGRCPELRERGDRGRYRREAYRASL